MYAESLRSAGDIAKDPLDRVNVNIGYCHGRSSCLWPVDGISHIGPNSVMDDYFILHEYAHFLQWNLGTLAWIASDHGDCTISFVVFGLDTEPLPKAAPRYLQEHAWLEGFADWFASAAALHVGGSAGFEGTVNPDLAKYDTKMPWCTVPDDGYGDQLELHLAAALWDLTDTSNEPGDTVGGFEKEIFQTMDIIQSNRWPTIDKVGTYLAGFVPIPQLDQVMQLNMIRPWYP
jgi:hypothetical protein